MSLEQDVKSIPVKPPCKQRMGGFIKSIQL